MSPLDSRKTYNNLLKKGFRESTTKSKDHKRVEFWYNGKLTPSRTKLSHNGEELVDYHIREMAKQTYMSKKQFVDFANCSLSEDQYIELLKTQKII